MKLEDLFMYRFYEKKDGPLVTIRSFDEKSISQMGYNTGVTNINEIYNNRIMIENLMYRLFLKKGGKPLTEYPYYGAVYLKLPEDDKLHVRFDEPECIKIPMRAFSKDKVSFTYGQSPRAFTRKDNHPTHRKLFMWDEIEEIINLYPYNKNEDTWIEMQIWEEDVIKYYYETGDKNTIQSFVVKEKLTHKQKINLIEKYQAVEKLLKKEYFFDPTSVHGVAHAMRVVVLALELAEKLHINDYYKEVLLYSAAYHDIGRTNHLNDPNHGYESSKKIKRLNLLPYNFDKNSEELISYIVENHQIDTTIAYENLKQYHIRKKDTAFQIYSILKDADILDRCRFGHVDKFYLHNDIARDYVSFAYQLLLIYKEFFDI